MSEGGARQRRVAVIDDEPDVLTYLRLALEDAGHAVLASSAPAEVLPALRSFAPDLICLDMLMPERMGLSLFVDIRRTPSLARVPVVILSGMAGVRDALDALPAEGDLVPPARYLEKPVEIGPFIATVGELLAGRKEVPA